MAIGEYDTFQEFLSVEAFRVARRQLPRTPLLYVHQNDWITVDGLWMEFGVYEGTTLNILAGFTQQTIYGFDSFQGLPEDWRAGKEQGRYSLHGQLPQVKGNVQLIPGWFEETLPEFLNRHSEPIAFVHIDCDLYSSTRTILSALKNRFVPGSVIVFDELFNYPGYEQHELKAFYEFLRETEIECEWIGIQGPVELVPSQETEHRVSGKYSGTAVVVKRAA
ncbi:MAG: hypothetical protein Tsb009_34970 [Planctomycetaceae bacterium]